MSRKGLFGGVLGNGAGRGWGGRLTCSPWSCPHVADLYKDDFKRKRPSIFKAWLPGVENSGTPMLHKPAPH